jgi:hypothetical protein
MKKQTGARWEITVDGRPRTYDHKRELAIISSSEYLKLKNPAANVTVRDLEGTEETIIIAAQQPRPSLRRSSRDGDNQSSPSAKGRCVLSTKPLLTPA